MVYLTVTRFVCKNLCQLSKASVDYLRRRGPLIRRAGPSSRQQLAPRRKTWNDLVTLGIVCRSTVLGSVSKLDTGSTLKRENELVGGTLWHQVTGPLFSQTFYAKGWK